MIHKIREMIENRNKGINCGIPSYCTANSIVIETALERAKITNNPVLIEATANQVNQFGGYTGLTPKDFQKFVFDIAEKVGTDKNLIILGGDHLGPLTWKSENEESAMQKANELVKLYIEAGFTKIHLDTSMKLGDDDANSSLSNEVIANRGALLYKTCIETFNSMKLTNDELLRPVFVIGSEVPIPGGFSECEEEITVTSVTDFEETIVAYKKAFTNIGFDNAWNDIVGIVVQPGVEFGDTQIFMYDRNSATQLCSALKKYPEIVFEGHSTDYQEDEKLGEMVTDGISILKVGPWLTFALREALFQLSYMENELVIDKEKSNFIEVLEKAMLENPSNWINHYFGSDIVKKLCRKYSFSDRCRYYLCIPEVEKAIDILFENLSSVEIPITMIHQFMPNQYKKIIANKLENTPICLAKDAVAQVMEIYETATVK